MKYFREFAKHADYTAFTATTEFKLPNVSKCVQENEMHYTPFVETCVVATFNVTSTTTPTKILYDVNSGFSAVEIDGVPQENVTTSYTFSTLGEHTVRYTLMNAAELSNSCLYECSDMTSVSIPSNVTSIGSNTFYGCSSLTSVTISKNVESIGDYAFDGCYSLSTIKIPSKLTNIGVGVFEACSGLTSITIPSSVTSIGNMAFNKCSGLTSIAIPDGVASIGDYAFSACTRLKSVTIGSGITSIGQRVFYKCSGLTKITVDAITPSTLGSYAFLYTNDCPIYVPCESMADYKAASGWSDYSARIRCDAAPITYTADNKLNVKLSAFTPAATAETYDPITHVGKIEFGGQLTEIGDGAFSAKTGLTSIVIPDGITSIGISGFAACRAITSITIPNSITSIGKSAFLNCFHMTSINIPSGITSISSGLFNTCSGLTSVTIPNSVTSIGISAFLRCSSLTSITINAETPPTLSSVNAFSATNNCTIYVPCYSFEDYKTANNWSTYASRMECFETDPYNAKYFTVKLKNDGTISYSANTSTNTVYYSTDDGANWASLASNSSTPTIQAGTDVLFKASSLTVSTTKGIGKISASTNFSVDGNIMSLISGDSFVGASTIPNNYQFAALFSGNTKIIDAENLRLPAKTLTSYSYYGLFSDCQNLLKGPRKVRIPSILPYSAFENMFKNCSSMTEVLMDVESLSCTSAGTSGCSYMFYNCCALTAITSLSAPTSQYPYGVVKLMPTSASSYAYFYMFYNCSALTQAMYINIDAIDTTWSNGMTYMMYGCKGLKDIYMNATTTAGLCTTSQSTPVFNWVQNMTSGGVFHTRSSASWSLYSHCGGGFSVIPNGWTLKTDIT